MIRNLGKTFNQNSNNNKPSTATTTTSTSTSTSSLTSPPTLSSTTTTTSNNQEIINQLNRLSSNLPFSLNKHHNNQSNLTLKTNLHHESKNLKLDMMSQLSCSQALLEANSFKLLDYDRFNQTKQTITKLEKQLKSINSKLNLELKILATDTLINTNLNQQHQLYQFPSRFKDLNDQKESIQSQLSELKTSSLQHLVAILALGFKRLEHQLQHSSPSPTHSHFLSPSTPLTTLSSTRSNPSSYPHIRFDGPHLFANHTTQSLRQNGFRPTDSPDRFPFSSSSPKLTPASNLLKEETESLKSLLSARDAIIAEQASDISLLELQVETLKQSLVDQSTNHKQQASAQSNSERNVQSQINTLHKENKQLSEALEASKELASSKEEELKLVKREIEILHSDRQVEQMTELNETLANRAREAEERARETSNVHAELESQLITLNADLETTRELGARALGERDSLEKELKASQDRLRALVSELESLRTETEERVAEGERRYTTLQTAHQAEWNTLASSLTNLSIKFNEPKLAQLLIQPLQPGQQAKFIEHLVQGLEDYISATSRLLQSNQDQAPALQEELDQVRRSYEQEKRELAGKLDELESQKQALERVHTQREGESAKAESQELEAVKLELVGIKQQLAATKEPNVTIEKSLRELWKSLPPNIEARAAASLDADLSSFKAVYEPPVPTPPPKKMGITAGGVGGSLGGLFGLGKRSTPTPTPSSASSTVTVDDNPSSQQTPPQEFSVEITLEKLRLLVENDKKMVERLFKYEAEKESHKNNSLRAQKLVTESQDALRTYQSQVKELEERLENADTQSAAMLEKVNDLMESEEKAHMIGKRAESTIQKYQKEINELKAQLTTTNQTNTSKGPSSSSENENKLIQEVQSLKDQIEDLNEELQDLRDREISIRDQFLKDLAELNQLNSALKVKNKALERSIKNQ